MTKPGPKLVALLVALPIVLAACGGGGGKVSATDYASTVCGSVKTWINDVKSEAASVQSAVGPGTTPTEGQDALKSYLDKVISSTDTMIGSVRDAGTPDVPNGDKLSTTLLGALQATETAFKNARTEVDSIPTNSRSAFQQAASTLGQEINSKVGSIGQSFQGLRSPELEKAFSQVPACQSA